MNNKVSSALMRLNQILPLAEHQQRLPPEAVRLHREILNSYARSGMAPLISELTVIDNRAESIVTQLRQFGLIVLDDDNNIIGAYPFTSEKRVHCVDLTTHSVHCMCALDALAVSTMLELRTTVHSRCALTAAPLMIMQNGDRIMNQSVTLDLFLAIDWSANSGTICCANSLCRQMNFISGKSLAYEWASKSDQHELFTLDEAIQFAGEFFVPHLLQEKGI